MSLEKRRESKEKQKEKELVGSSFRRVDFTPLQYIEEEKEELGITRTPFLKHIMTLERFKLIRSKKIGKSLHYFLADIPEDYDKFKVVFINPLIPKLIEEIFKEEGISISKIGEELDVYSGTVQYHLKKLKELDLVKSVKTQKKNKIHVVNIELLKKFNGFFDEPDFSKLLNGL